MCNGIDCTEVRRQLRQDAERINNVADIVTYTYKEGNDVVVVVSAQGDTTDDLIEKANEINAKPVQAGDGYAALRRGADFHLAAGHGHRKAGLPGGFPAGLAGGFRPTPRITATPASSA